jgi:predicted nuclease with RNAse H fold
VRVVGVDLAAEPVRTAVALLEWNDGKAVVEDLRIGADDEAVLAAVAAADKAGIDAPFGWPDAFAAFLAGLLAKLGNAGHLVDRDGSGTVAEVYPAASLKQWGLPYRGYKRPRDLGALPELVTALEATAPWLELGSHDRLCRTSHDALDAVIAALTARAAALSLTLRPDPERQPQASREGWIALPTVPLTELT